MNNRRFGVLVAAVMAICLGVQAQGARSFRINEILITNEENFEDDYGVRNSWIEIFNTSFASVDLKGCFLTNDPNNPTKYPIPKGDVLTLIKPRQHTLFWADDQPSRGTFHVNFKLDPTKENYIALYESNGKKLVDEVTIPAGILKADQSYARKEDGSQEWVIKDGGYNNYVTPSSNNMILDKNEKIENFKIHDEMGLGMTVTAMAVVFFGLILLYLVFKFVGNTAVKMGKRNAMKAHGITDKKEAREKQFGQRAGEEFAAISMAMHEYLNDVHDIEDMIITINKVKRTYSPWSSKIYTLRETPKK